MADVSAAFRDQLKAFELDVVHFTGEELGKGSYGSVEIVEVTGERCAAKILHEALVESNSRLPNQRARGRGYQPRSLIEAFTTECTLMSEVRHPNIVRFLGICYHRPGESIPVIVMELLKTCLHELLESETRKSQVIPLSVKLCILLDVSKGLVHLHSLDIVHRDLTARNVLLSQSLTAKIADLGMARLIELKPGRQEATMTKGPGNANYMPPEARDGGPMTAQYGKPIDCFSMGHLILFTTTQEFPEPLYPTYFDSQSKTTKVRTEIERREDNFQAAVTEVGQDHPLLQVASQCLQNNPQVRPIVSEIMMQIQEEAVGELRQKNLKLESDLNEHQRQSQQVIDELTRDVEDLQSKHVEAVKEKEALLKKLEQQQEVHKPKPVIRNEVSYPPKTPFSQEQTPPNTAIANTVPYDAVGEISEEHIVDPEANKEEHRGDTRDDNLVTPEWLNEIASEDRYGYDNLGQSKGFKNYVKAAPDLKQKTAVSETLGHQQTNEPSPNLPNLDTPEPDTTRVQAYGWQHNDFENRPAGHKPIAKRRNKLGVEKSATDSHVPTLTIETPCKPYTSPLSSLELQSVSSSDSEDLPNPPILDTQEPDTT